MALVPLIYVVLAITSTFSAGEGATLKLETSSKDKDHVLELREQGTCSDVKDSDTCKDYKDRELCWIAGVDDACKKTCGLCVPTNPCETSNGGCEQICTYNSEKKYPVTCSCNSGTLHLDGKSCSPAEPPTEAPTESPSQAPTESPAQAQTERPTNGPTSVSPSTEDSLRGCGLAVMDKCYEHNPPDGSLPGNLIEEIGAVQNATTCQQFCKELYNNSCEWFMYDRRTTDCKLFRGSLSNLEKDCAESGYAIRPSYNDCTVTNVMKHDGCYNFREDYCRFEFTLLDNLESIEKIEDCQTACKYLTNCTFFIYDSPSKICKVNTDPFDKRTCDIVHGSKDPSLQQCLDEGKIPWTSKVVSTA